MKARTSVSSPPQIGALTGLRGIAAWLVVLYHIRLSLTEIVPPQIIGVFAKGYLAVDLFFMLSGFVMWLNYGSRFAESGLRMTPQFLWKRFARIWPLHALVLGSMICFAVLLAVTGRSTEGYPAAELPLHIMLMQNWGLTGALSWNHPAWSISTEFAAYLLFPLLACALRWDRIAKPALLGLLGLLFLSINAYFAWRGYAHLGEDIASTGLLRCLAEFSVGIVLANLWQKTGQGAVPSLLWGLAAAGMAVIGLQFALAETLVIPPIIAALLMVCASDRGPCARFLSSRLLVWLGDVSYATYLTHFFLFILFKIAVVDTGLQMGWTQLAAFLAMVLLVSAALFHLFEKPSQRWLNARAPRFARTRLASRPPLH